jgi:hypothetical protein
LSEHDLSRFGATGVCINLRGQALLQESDLFGLEWNVDEVAQLGLIPEIR